MGRFSIVWDRYRVVHRLGFLWDEWVPYKQFVLYTKYHMSDVQGAIEEQGRGDDVERIRDDLQDGRGLDDQAYNALNQPDAPEDQSQDGEDLASCLETAATAAL